MAKKILGAVMLFGWGGAMVLMFMTQTALYAGNEAMQRQIDAVNRDPLRQWAMGCVSKANSKELHNKVTSRKLLTLTVE